MKIIIENHVNNIKMPENLKVGLMIDEQRKKCAGKCPFDYYQLAFGQSPFFVPRNIQEALGKNADKGHYASAQGIDDLRQAVATFNKEYFGIDASPKRIIIGPGTKSLMHMVFDIIKGDVILPSPSWIGYYPQITLLDKHFHTFHTCPQKGIDPEKLDVFLRELHEEQHILVLNNPHNPTGKVYSKEELEKIADVCRKHNTYILADEIYAMTTYDIDSFVSMATIYPEGTFVSNGMSKDRSAGGYRLGSLILPKDCSDELISAFNKVAATVYTNVSTPTQYAAITAYTPNKELEEYFQITRKIHNLIGNWLSEQFGKIEGVVTTKPEGSFYFYADFNQLSEDLKRKGVMNSNELAKSLLSHPFHIAVVTGDAVMLKAEDYGARVAFVDYDGEKAYEEYKQNPVKEPYEFIRKVTPRIAESVEVLKRWAAYIRE